MKAIANDVGVSYLQWCVSAGVNPLYLTHKQRCDIVRAWRDCVDPSVPFTQSPTYPPSALPTQ